jgi:hypothetical protein
VSRERRRIVGSPISSSSSSSSSAADPELDPGEDPEREEYSFARRRSRLSTPPRLLLVLLVWLPALERRVAAASDACRRDSAHCRRVYSCKERLYSTS